MNGYKFYIYFSDNKRNLIESNKFQETFKQFLNIIRNDNRNSFISFGINKGCQCCDLAFNEYVKKDNKNHLVFSRDNLMFEIFNNNLVNINIKTIMHDLL